MSLHDDWSAEDRRRAVYHLTRRRGGAQRFRAGAQADALFPEPERQARKWIPLPAEDDAALFGAPAQQHRQLVPVEGWPDYQDTAP
ncbi:hypothetical protein [Mycobacterium paragordonae]|uniref:hypothetical protein n=1 Tax=Mycobacterium paragordonae TaxID=1389713 RepID=UPI0012E11BD7|nr:hypothetical protein [Mycobacterium paragordonae]